MGRRYVHGIIFCIDEKCFLSNLSTSCNDSPLGPHQKKEILVREEQERETESMDDAVVDDDENKYGQRGKRR